MLIYIRKNLKNKKVPNGDKHQKMRRRIYGICSEIYSIKNVDWLLTSKNDILTDMTKRNTFAVYLNNDRLRIAKKIENDNRQRAPINSFFVPNHVPYIVSYDYWHKKT